MEDSALVPNVKPALVQALRDLSVSKQKLSAETNRQSTVALMLGLSNRAQCLQLAEQQQHIMDKISIGEKVFGSIQQTVRDHGDLIADAKLTIEEQHESIYDLEKQVAMQQQSIEVMVKQYQKEMMEQRQMIEKHKNEFRVLVLSKLKQDASLDGAILLVSWMMLKVPIVYWPVSAFSAAIGVLPVFPVTQRRRTLIMSNVTKLLLLTIFARALRITAARHGLHNAVGNPNVYVSQMIAILKNKFKPQNDSAEENRINF